MIKDHPINTYKCKVFRQSYNSFIIALDKVGKEVKWLLNFFLKDIPSWSKYILVICIHYVIQFAIDGAYNNK
jgi:hypothetical protein